MGQVELNSMTLEELKEYMKYLGEKGFRGEQIFTYFHKNKEVDITQLQVLPKKLRNKLFKKEIINKTSILERLDSNIDDTSKYLFLLEDKNIVEGVFMRYPHGVSVCISTQVGCKMGCRFCASTKGGLVRNLTPAEMVNQIYLMERDMGVDINNIVLMGSGEPLDNYDNVIKFLNIIHDSKGHNISYRNITLSTCGIVPEIYDLADEGLPITLSISLHSPFNKARSKMMPISRTYNISNLIDACIYYEKATNRRVSFEYTLIEGVNDKKEDAEKLSHLLKDLKSHVNLIPLNPIKEYNKERPELNSLKRFKEMLGTYNVNTTIRQEKGLDINASCGQLRRDYLNKSN
ncbi:MAG TPA: 23S rRNA (adenine(2503)-C(2))-methyltransferase RlmN [Tissierellaceae bacterium]|nr:23S rRNA (adenine(2503)-C(2))-methyltransferase RlmN [Tissierellaceae bacterium]